MNHEQMVLELLGKSGQDYQEVMKALLSERNGFQTREIARDEIFLPKANPLREVEFELAHEVETVCDAWECFTNTIEGVCSECEARAERKKEIAEFTERQMAIGEEILRKLR